MVDLSFLKKNKLIKRFVKQPAPERGSPAGLISRACQLHQNINLTIDGKLDRFRTFFVSMDEDGRAFFVDSLTPRDGADILIPGKTVTRVTFDMYGVGRRFRAVYEGTEKVGKFDSLKFLLPERVDEIQRHQYFRVRPRLNDPVEVGFKHSDNLFNSEVIDISAGGISFSSDERVNPGSTVDSVITLPSNYKPLRTRLSTRSTELLDASVYSKKDSKAGRYRIRAQFKSLDLGDTQALDRYIMERQRDTIKINL